MEQFQGKLYARSFTEAKLMKRKRLPQKNNAQKSEDGEGKSNFKALETARHIIRVKIRYSKKQLSTCF